MAENQTSFDFGAGDAQRNHGMATAADNAEFHCPGWAEDASRFLMDFLQNGQRFLCEDVRAFATERGLPEPPSKRAWGSVITSAARSGLIRQVGYGCVKNARAHRTPAAIWEPCQQDRQAA